MNIFQNSGILFLFLLFIVLTGIGLNRSGFAYGSLVLTLHKLLSLAVLVIYFRHLYLLNRTESLSGGLVVLAAITVLFFIGAMITGGLVSTEKYSTRLLLILHRLLSILTILGIGLTRVLLKYRID
ncbi:MAG: hypothetical protein U5R06_19805 [candidate division KSB1 bacterium]|nr:hypothetical protein [candidate division KSB1 bacterium]